MSRRSNAGIDTRKSDPIYRNRLVNMMVNRILRDGKKSISYEIIYHAMERIERTTGKNPLSISRQAVRAVAPNVVVGARRIGGSTYQIPVEIEPVQGKALAIRWILVASRKRSGRGMASKLGSELMDAARNSGSAVRKREETHKMAESNRAFSHFR